MNIIKNILKKNPCYKNGKTITVKGLMLHSIGTPQPKAKAVADYWNQSNMNVCVHGIIDGLTGDVLQTLPWNYRAWHCGSGSKGSYNNDHIGVEMCEPDCIKYKSGATFTCSDKKRAKEIVKRTYNTAVELFAKLCTDYKLNPLKDGVIVSHHEGHERGYASGHADPEHLWTQLGLSYTMNGFRKDVAKKMGIEETEPEKKKFPYMVRVTTKSLNVREGAGTEYKVTCVIGENESYTIIEELDGWGKLLSDAGWINLKYTEKV